MILIKSFIPDEQNNAMQLNAHPFVPEHVLQVVHLCMKYCVYIHVFLKITSL